MLERASNIILVIGLTAVLTLFLVLGSIALAPAVVGSVTPHEVQQVVHSGQIEMRPSHPLPPDRPYVATRPMQPTNFHQVGFMYDEGKTMKAPLYGRPAPRNPSRWQYFVRTDDVDIRVGIRRNGKPCMDDVGCEELQSGDFVDAPEIMDGQGKVHIYDRLMD